MGRTTSAFAAVTFVLAAVFPAARGFAREPDRGSSETATTEAAITQRMNANTVTIVTGTPGGTYFRAGADLAFALDDGDRLRILPILGKGAGENAYDVRFLKGVDIGFVRTDTLNQLRQDPRLRNIERRIHYIAKLFNDELHIIAPREIEDLSQLSGKKVTFDVKGSGTDYTGRAMFRGLGVDVEALNVDQPTAFEMLRKGEVSAVVSVAAKPVAIVSGFDAGDRFHLLKAPYTERTDEAYIPATLTSSDYPKLVRDGEKVETLAVGTILAAYNSPVRSDRYNRVAHFVDAFFSHYDRLLAPQRHPKWREVNLSATVSNWTRFRPAQEWLDAHTEQELASNAELEMFLNEAAPSQGVDKERLFEAFLRWRHARQSAMKASGPAPAALQIDADPRGR